MGTREYSVFCINKRANPYHICVFVVNYGIYTKVYINDGDYADNYDYEMNSFRCKLLRKGQEATICLPIS
ncbi:hypothetical protein PIROE2DRAFT_16619 [Piromyces sp. E2]|nr:hypothetical protein PIROE2DRAFT_16619 [Piromyces sp. E2]|eukprot:OUM58176.1 hypothetical protein PIROE2DRAFT_16619 [Piromyces sp. E2]